MNGSGKGENILCQEIERGKLYFAKLYNPEQNGEGGKFTLPKNTQGSSMVRQILGKFYFS